MRTRLRDGQRIWDHSLDPRAFTNVGLIIIDEAHYVGSQSYDSIMCMFPDAVIIGFTATPFRGNKLMTNMFERVAYTISMGDLIDQGYLVPPKLKLTPFNTADPAELYAGIVEVIKNHPDEKIVVYLKTIADAEECRNIIVDNGFTCSAITSKFKGKNRDLLLEEYRSGNGPQVLTTVDVLTAGFDSPNLSVIIMPYKVGSVTTYLQRVGRGLRINPGKTHCDIYVGGKNPKLDGGFWERITRQMLKQGRNEYDNYLDDLDFLKDELSEEEYEWTVDVVNMAKAVGKKNMNGLFECIINKEFPVDLLNTFIENHPIVPNKKLLKMRLTDKQFDKLDQFGIDGSCLSRGEAMSTIASIIRKEGTYDKRDIVPSGKYKGYFFNEVPTSYWSMLGGKIGGFKYSKSAGKSGGLVDKYNDFKRRNNL